MFLRLLLVRFLAILHSRVRRSKRSSWLFCAQYTMLLAHHVCVLRAVDTITSFATLLVWLTCCKQSTTVIDNRPLFRFGWTVVAHGGGWIYRSLFFTTLHSFSHSSSSHTLLSSVPCTPLHCPPTIASDVSPTSVLKRGSLQATISLNGVQWRPHRDRERAQNLLIVLSNNFVCMVYRMTGKIKYALSNRC